MPFPAPGIARTARMASRLYDPPQCRNWCAHRRVGGAVWGGGQATPAGPQRGLEGIKKWTRTQRIRTVAAVPLGVPLFETAPRPTYQEIAKKARHMNRLGLSHAAIARRLRVTGKTVAKAIAWINGETGP